MKTILSLLTIMAVSACTSDYQIIRHDNKQFSTADSFYVSTPDSGRYGATYYVKSGEMTRNILVNDLIARGIRAMGTVTINKNDAMIEARQQGYSRLIYPTILHWEDRATEWNMMRDRAKVRINIIDAETGQLLDDTLLDLVGTWWTMGGLHPQDLVEEATTDYFNKLF